MNILVGIDPISGLEMYREADYFTPGIKEPKITVYYYQWLKSPTGLKMDVQHKRYVVIDIPAVIIKSDPILVTSEILYDDGITVLTPAVYREDDIIVTPANLGYTAWKRKLITAEMVGMTLGDDIIIGSINSKLSEMPFDAIDNYIGN